MITLDLIEKTKVFAQIDGPKLGHINIANDAGQKISQALQANSDIVLLGTLLMDCALGTAIKQGNMPEHIKMSHDSANNFLNQDTDIGPEEKQSVLNCILEHHGSQNFSSLESEIVCNADCYRFASIPGFYFALTQFDRDLVPDMTLLFKTKFQEKASLLTLDFAKDDLKDQINTITNFVKYI